MSESSISPRPRAEHPTVAAAESLPVPGPAVDQRVRAEGKFLYVGREKFDIKGVTYGPFRPTEDGCEYHDEAGVEADFAAIAAAGFNAVRVYTVPPRFLLDLALAHGLRVMVGLPWEQHVTFLDDRKTVRRIMETVRDGVRACAGHDAVLCYALGNEIPAPVVRWLGPAAVEAFLKRLYQIAKAEDPRTLATYVSYPTTEYLQLPFLDFITFNVYLETERKTADYVARLQNIAGELPLVMAEVGLDSMRNGEDQQAEVLSWQVRTTLQGGCAGTFVFSWTDEWFRGGHDIDDWAFGLVTRDRRPKPALERVQEALREPLLPAGATWPFISIVVCSYNGASTIRQTCEHILRLDYTNFEVVVIDDGSVDATAAIVGEYDFRLISTPNRGLSAARNLGMREAKGDIVAYIDDDAYPDPHWLSFLAIGFLTRDHVGIGGPNLAPHDDGAVADCVANSPGGPSHVLYTDLLAEHLPGCNMAFRREAILAIAGFDEQFRIAGDDVDLCWRLIEQGGTLGFHAGAVVWHHRRGKVRDYFRQQRNYGRAEAMLEQKWPEKYNRFGHLRWAGTLYGKGHTRPMASGQSRIHHGVWGSRLFQSMYVGDFESAWYITLMPEWYLLTVGLVVVVLLGFSWAPLFWAWPLLVFAMVVPLVQVAFSTAKARFTSRGSGRSRLGLYLLTAAFHVGQPMTRLLGRMGHRLTPWRRHGEDGFAVPRTRHTTYWSEQWRDANAWLEILERKLQRRRVLVRRGGDCDRWDLQAGCGLFGGARLLAVVEEHGGGKQLLRVRAWPRVAAGALILVPLLTLIAVGAWRDQAFVACGFFLLAALLGLYRAVRECGIALYTVDKAARDWRPDVETASDSETPA